MDLGVPRARGDERRVPLTPQGCAALVAVGHRPLVETGAGRGAGWSDDEYARAGAQLVWSAEEAFGRADLVLTLDLPAPREAALLREGGLLAGFLHLAAAPAASVDALAARRVTALALELYEDDGARPLLVSLSEIAGRLAPQLAARWLETRYDAGQGRGTLLCGAPGVAPAEVVIIGAGTVGAQASRGFLALGAQVTVLDHDVARLRALDQGWHPRPRLVHASAPTIARAVAFADALIGAVHVPGERAPVLVREADVRTMKPGAVVIDYAIDQGGCLETSRPTSVASPVYEAHGVIHCCLPNATALVARTASQAISHEVVRLLARVGADPARAAREGALRSAVALQDGRRVR